jgi:uncharacterized membrane protein
MIVVLSAAFFVCVLVYLLRDAAISIRKPTDSELVSAALIGLIFYVVARWTPPS